MEERLFILQTERFLRLLQNHTYKMEIWLLMKCAESRWYNKDSFHGLFGGITSIKTFKRKEGKPNA